MNRKHFCLFLMIWVAFPTVWAEDNIRPGINRHYQGADVGHWRSVFEREGREVWDRRHDIVAALGLRPGMRVADVGAGTGFFSFMFARSVGAGGHVYAIDVTPEFVADIESRARGLGLRQLSALRNDQRGIGLNAASVDLVFICDTYHHFEYPRSTLRSIHRALRPDGQLVVIDYRRIPGLSSPWVMQHVRAGSSQVQAEIEQQGFKLVERHEFMQSQYMMRFKRQEGGNQ